MRLIDAHAHLDFPQFDNDRAVVLDELSKESIGVINIATTLSSIDQINNLTLENKLVWGTVGLHPNDVEPGLIEKLPAILKEWEGLLHANAKLVALGEVGLDYFHGRSKGSAHLQQGAFRQFLAFAKDSRLPLVIHCREAYGDLLMMLEEFKGVRGVVHCFGGTAEQAKKLIDLGLNISFTANITYPANEPLRLLIAELPLEAILLETDSPFLAPQSARGKRNDPRAVVEVAKTVAAIKDIEMEDVARQTTQTAKDLFNLDW